MSSLAQQNNEKSKPIEEYLKKADVLLDKRFLHFAFNCLGKNAEVQLENGKKGQGKFFTSSLENGGIVLKNFNETDSKDAAVPSKVLTRNDFVYLLVRNVEEPPLLGAKKDVFKTDAEISKKKEAGKRTLVKWSAEESSGGDTPGLVLEDIADQRGKWNQFEMNQKKFGLKSDFEEGMYTTHIDMKSVSSDLLAKAARIEAEIMNSTSDYDNRHIREERGLQALREDNENEEEAYSSVIRTDKPKVEAAEDKKIKKFTNSKREKAPDAPQNATENRTEGNKSSLSIPITETDGSSRFNANESPFVGKDSDRTPQGADEGRLLSRQMSNLSDDTGSNKHKTKLSIVAKTFEASGEAKPKEEPKPKEEQKVKEEEKPKPVITKQASLETDEKKFNISDYNSGIITKFKLKVNEKEIKKSSATFFEIAIPNWQKKLTTAEPSSINPNWKTAKTAALSVPPIKAAISTPATSTANTAAKPFKPSPATPYQGGIPNYARPNDAAMMYPPTFVAPGFVQANPMGFMPYGMPQQKFQPGFPYQQGGFPPQFQNPVFVDPNQPSFNMGYPHNNSNSGNTGNRQNSMKNFSKKT